MKKNKIEILDIVTLLVVLIFLALLLFFKFSYSHKPSDLSQNQEIENIDIIDKSRSKKTNIIPKIKDKLQIIPASLSADLKSIPQKYFFESKHLGKKIKVNGIPYQMTLDLSDVKNFLNKEMIVVEIINESSFIVENNIGIYKVDHISQDNENFFFIEKFDQETKKQATESAQLVLENSSSPSAINYFKNINKKKNETPLFEKTNFNLKQFNDKIKIGDFIELEADCENLCQKKNYLELENNNFKINKLNIYEKIIN
jgi:hypothetical protein